MAIDYSRHPAIVNMIKKEEGFSKTAYRDAHGYSIGYGHFIRKGEEHLRGKSITQDYANKLLYSDIQKNQAPWIGGLKEGTPIGVIAGLTSFAYNVGAHKPVLKRVVKLINQGKTEAGANLLQGYCKARSTKDGPLKPVPALVKRRAKEKSMIISGKADDSQTVDFTEMLTSIDNTPTIESTEIPISAEGFSMILNENKRCLDSLAKLTGEMQLDTAWEQRILNEGLDRWQASL